MRRGRRMSLGVHIAVLLAVVIAAAIGIGASLWWLLGRPPLRQSTGWSVANSFDFAKIVLTVIGGVGAVAALVIAYRKQRLGEEADRREDVKLFAERFTKASDQLGSEFAPVRLAALYALADLGQGTPDQRQTIINVLCAYLRMPYRPPVDTEDERGRQEREVRLTAQRLLEEHLQPGQDRKHPRAKFWKDIDLDLVGATLVHFSLSRCQVRLVNVEKARFEGDAYLRELRCERLWMKETVFSKTAQFTELEASMLVLCDRVTFQGHASFVSAKFSPLCTFTESTFHASVDFTDAEFGPESGLGRVWVRPDRQSPQAAWPAGHEVVEDPEGRGWYLQPSGALDHRDQLPDHR
ncbi:hypothetical protein D5S17_31525 [Pseudonocardiaceae bacterium YIM PH 21723]|nr:hypothetical protein D5S17_31525 [Pseudonocardiaceae bacterium YIM PH 21723]